VNIFDNDESHHERAASNGTTRHARHELLLMEPHVNAQNVQKLDGLFSVGAASFEYRCPFCDDRHGGETWLRNLGRGHPVEPPCAAAAGRTVMVCIS
jgi:hypothetical protein